MPILNVAKVVIRRKADGKYLILRGSKWEERPDRSQKPDLPGGIVEVDETIEQGAVREVKEEAGITLRPEELLLVQAHSFQSDKDQAAINRLIYFAELKTDPEIQLSWEHEGYWWYDATEILDLDIRSPYPEVFKYLHQIGVLI